MTTRLILVRHGNTFNPGETPVWVGARTDLPLVPKGVEQARALGEALKAAAIIPTALFCGPLQRTRRAAEIAAEIAGFDAAEIKIDARLTEIDYGKWEAKSSEEIEAMGFAAAQDAWNKQCVYPKDADWQPTEDKIIADTDSVMADAARIGGDVVVVSSNGILRYYARAGINAAAFPDRKVATGAVCVMAHDGAGWRIERWNQPPQQAFL